eukprot:COSAG01_NODE_1190_length_11321_cov_15.842809_3_plen_138_part_00
MSPWRALQFFYLEAVQSTTPSSGVDVGGAAAAVAGGVVCGARCRYQTKALHDIGALEDVWVCEHLASFSDRDGLRALVDAERRGGKDVEGEEQAEEEQEEGPLCALAAATVHSSPQVAGQRASAAASVVEALLQEHA